MSDVRWLQAEDGARLGVQATDGGLRLIFPDGSTKLITEQDAPRIISMLQEGISFSEITGAPSFRVSPDDF